MRLRLLSVVGPLAEQSHQWENERHRLRPFQVTLCSRCPPNRSRQARRGRITRGSSHRSGRTTGAGTSRDSASGRAGLRSSGAFPAPSAMTTLRGLSEGQHPFSEEQLVRHQVSRTYEGKSGRPKREELLAAVRRARQGWRRPCPRQGVPCSADQSLPRRRSTRCGVSIVKKSSQSQK